MAAGIVITGAPASGKTTCLERLKTDPALNGVIFLEEVARLFLEQQPDLRHDKAALHRAIYRRQREQEDSLAGRRFITDRGTLDAAAFHPNLLKELGTSTQQEYRRYTAVVQLGSAAALGSPYYKTDEVRRETVEETMAIEAALKHLWQNHTNYRFVAATENWEDKYNEARCYIVAGAFRAAAMDNSAPGSSMK